MLATSHHASHVFRLYQLRDGPRLYVFPTFVDFYFNSQFINTTSISERQFPQWNDGVAVANHVNLVDSQRMQVVYVFFSRAVYTLLAQPDSKELQ